MFDAMVARVAGATPGRRLGWRIVVVVGILAACYMGWVTAQYNRLNDLNQRELANASAEVKRAIENAIETVNRFQPGSKTSGTDASGHEWFALCRFLDDQPYLDAMPGEPCEQRIAGFHGAKPTLGPPLGVEAKGLASASVSDQPGDDKVTFRFAVDRVLQELSFTDSFGLIFVATDDGSVLYQDTPSKREWLRHLRWGERQFRDSAADRSGALQLQQLKGLFGPETNTNWSRLQSMSGRTTLALGGMRHEVYFEPLVIENGEKTSLVIGGAVPFAALMRQALAVDTYFLTGLVFLLLFAVLGFPFVKLIALHPQERFTRSDVRWLYVSTAALLLLFTFAAQGVDAYVRWHAQADEGLKRLADRLERDVVHEVGAIRDQLVDYDRKVGRSGVSAMRGWPFETDWFDSRSTRLPMPNDALHVEQVTWVGSRGEQIWKTTADSVPAKSPLGDRVYVRAVRDGRGSLFRTGRTDTPFYVGPDRSIRDGKFYTFVSVPSTMVDVTAVVARAQLLSLETPPLPSGYGFALINREGRVLYHADARRALRENFFEELGDGRQARAIVYADGEGPMTSRYRERPHQLYFRHVSLARAVDGTPAGLYLVTFRDTAAEDSIVARMVAAALVGPLPIVLVFIGVSLILGMLVPARLREHWLASLWPQGGLEPMYKRLSAALWAVLTVGLVVSQTTGSTGVLTAMAPVALATAVAMYAHAHHPVRARRPLGSRLWFAVMVTLLFLSTIVVPASAAFRSAVALEFGRLIAAERTVMAAARADMENVIEAGAREENHSLQVARRLVRAREAYVQITDDPLSRPPQPFDEEPVPLSPAAALMVAPFEWADAALPVDNGDTALLRYNARRNAFTPPGTMVAWLPVSARGLMCLIAVVALLVWLTWWKETHVFFADLQAVGPADPLSPAQLWQKCDRSEQCVLLQVCRERVINPHQRPLVERLVRRGLITLDPHPRPSTEAFERFIRSAEDEHRDDLRLFEAVDAGHSWRFVRIVLAGLVLVLGLFLVVTQPALQSSLVTITGALTGLITAASKLRGALTEASTSQPVKQAAA